MDQEKLAEVKAHREKLWTANYHVDVKEVREALLYLYDLVIEAVENDESR